MSDKPKSGHEMPEYIVSACLAGFSCRYDGQSRPCKAVVDLYKTGKARPVCPESLSGLPAPRQPCELLDGKAYLRDGRDVTAQMENGAAKALQKSAGCRKAILKARSPSCGFGHIYDGTFSKSLCLGNGLFAQKLLDAGFELFDENNLPPELAER